MMADQPFSVKTKLERLPDSPGVYLFHDDEGSIIYIGKAKSLRSRVRSYFGDSRSPDLKTDFLSRHVRDLEYVVTDTEVEALILESSLVKKHQPKLNVRLKDDKAFLHIKLTVNEPYPRVLLTRRVRQDGALYFGPYLPASLARATVKIINRHFLLRSCSISIDGQLDRPCLEYYIQRCLAPCVEGLCTRQEYQRAVEDVILLLEGKNEELIAKLEEKMLEAAEDEKFEAAAFFRDRIRLVRELAEKQKMASTDSEDIDIFAYYQEGPKLALQIFRLREGSVVGKREYYWEDLEFFEPRSFLRDAVQQYYANVGFVPQQIYLPTEIEDQELLAEWLNQKKSSSRRQVRILTPKRGQKLDLLLLVERNAKISFEGRFKIRRSAKQKTLDHLQRELSLPERPRRIEAFDISNIQGDETVASLVVASEGIMDRNEYRRFKIKTTDGPDDFAAMQEVVFRRYRRLLDEEKPLPDLILVDGGKGQLHSAYQALAELGIEDLPLASIAKREELVFLQGVADPLELEWNSPALHLLQEIRDEAHRFAVGYHRKRRKMRDFTSELDSIPGIGPKRKKRLLQNFGSLRRIKRATIEQLTPYVGQVLARRIKEELSD